MKLKICSILCALILSISFLACSCSGEQDDKYTGAEISSIEYEIVDFMGGATYTNKLDFSTGCVYFKRFIPYNSEQSHDFTISYTIDTAKNEEIINEFYKIGILSLDELYENHDVCDGGSWELTIEYADGAVKKSKGINAGPTELFYAADDSFFEITNERFFNNW